MSWGKELWDRYDGICAYTAGGIDYLDTIVAGFVKERGVIEGEYAKKLRALVKKYSPRADVAESQQSSAGGHDHHHHSNKGARPATGTLGRTSGRKKEAALKSGAASLIVPASGDDEYSHVKAFKQTLNELGYIAGQHELLAESFSKDNYKYIHEQVKKLKEIRKRNIKEYERHQHDLKAAYKAMESCKEKFRKAFDEQERAQIAYNEASSDGNVTKNDIKKLHLQVSAKISQCDAMKCQYANQMLKTNDFRQRYYGQLLPSVLDELESMERTRITLMKNCILEMVGKETEVMPIIAKCHDAIKDACNSVRPDDDTSMAVEKFKTGDVPPGDFKLDGIRDPQALLAQDTLAENMPTNFKLYPRKRELEKQIEATEAELKKGRRELEGLRKMMDTFKSQPKFGKSDNFKNEVDVAAVKVNDLEKLLLQLKSDHKAVEAKLQQIQNRDSPLTQRTLKRSEETNSPMLSTMQRTITARSSNVSSPNHSIKSSSNLSISSSSGGSSTCQTNSPASLSADGVYSRSVVIGHQIAKNSEDVGVSGDRMHDVEDYQVASLEEEEDQEEDEFPPPPLSQMRADSSAPQPFSSTSSESSSSSAGAGILVGIRRCEALYDFHELESNNLPMEAGEQFLIVEDDCDGWTRVKQLSPCGQVPEEGYVPSSYLRKL